MKNYETVEILQSLIKAEWNIVRIGNSQNKNINVPVQDDVLCGILFYKKYAFAGNGHWFLRITLDDSYAETPYFYDYNLDDVRVADNPYGECMDELFSEVTEWKNFATKIRPQDFIDGVDSCLGVLKERRLYNIHMEYYDGYIQVTLIPKRTSEEIKYFKMPVYSSEVAFLPVTLNLTYMYKLMELFKEYYYVIELCTDDATGVVLKGKRVQSNKPDIRVRLENFVV